MSNILYMSCANSRRLGPAHREIRKEGNFNFLPDVQKIFPKKFGEKPKIYPMQKFLNPRIYRENPENLELFVL